MKKFFYPKNRNEQLTAFFLLCLQIIFYGLYWQDYLSVLQFMLVETWFCIFTILFLGIHYFTKAYLPLLALTHKKATSLFAQNGYLLVFRKKKVAIYCGSAGVIICGMCMLPGAVVSSSMDFFDTNESIKQISKEINAAHEFLKPILPQYPIYQAIIFHGSTLLQFPELHINGIFCLSLRDDWTKFLSQIDGSFSAIEILNTFLQKR